MGILKTLIGGSDMITQPIEAIGNILDKLFTSKDEKLTHEEIKNRLALQPNLAQVELNKIEAQHRNLFVAGWRPFIGWICGFSLLYSFILRDLIAWLICLCNIDIVSPPELATEHLMTVLMGMLGLGGLRTFEKIKGKTK